MGAKVDVDLSGLEQKFSESSLRAKQAVFAQRVAFDMRKHVPVDEGTLRDSEPMSSNYEQGYIIWNTPYAERVYEADNVRTVKNHQAKPHWADYTKKKKMEDWRQFAAELLSGDANSIAITTGGGA